MKRWMTAIIVFMVLAALTAILIMPLFNPNMAVYVTVVALAVALTLQKYVASFAGYFVLRSSKLFCVGDRIRIGNLGIKGDVRHIGPLHFTLDEVGEGEKSGGEVTGRLVHVPNHVVLDQHVLNFSQDFTSEGKLISCDYVFDEVRIPLPKGTSVKKARSILESILQEEDSPYLDKARHSFGDDSPNFVEEASNSPRVMMFADTSGIWLVGRFVSPVRGRNNLRSLITTRFVEAMESASASPGLSPAPSNDGVGLVSSRSP